ncbi:dockerin type I repeat-containing protein [uncultured Ruminococcus sp.]|uniref:dockerin type I repeat-containing protein n=1 Tax=uncultured Ruminococcus sp. TaxID=165186 RepID=UPI00261A97C6|nr:dockerin type I repeat-containing protein [uncultured Ruminococcus sp.]
MRFMKQMISVVLASAMAASVCCAGMSTAAADGNDLSVGAALIEEGGFNVPDWVPQDFESAFNFTNDHGSTQVNGNYFCIVTKVAGSEEKSFVEAKLSEGSESVTLLSNRNYSYDPGQTTTTTNIFGDGQRLPDYYYNVMVFEFSVDIDAEINVGVYEKGEEPVEVISKKYSLTMSMGTLTENGFFGWLPDSIGEFERFREEHGDVSLVNGYLVYCGDILYAGGFDLVVRQSEPKRLELVLAAGVATHYMYDMRPAGGRDHIIQVYKPVSEGDVDISFSEERYSDSYDDEMKGEIKHLTIDRDMTIIDRDTRYPDWVPVDFESTVEFLRKHGKTYGADGLICTVRTAESSDELAEERAVCRSLKDSENLSREDFLISERTFEFALPEKPDKSDTMAYISYLEYLERLGLTEDMADRGEVLPTVYRVSVYKALPDSFIEISHYSFDRDTESRELIADLFFRTEKDENDNVIINETDIYGWLPDSEEEYNAYIEENGNISVHDKYIVYCGRVPVCAGYDLFAETKGSADIKKSASYEVYIPDLSILDGGSSPMVVLFEGTKAGKAQVDFYIAHREHVSKSAKDIIRYIKIGNLMKPELIDEKDMPEKVAGDCNWDGLVSISDVIMLQRWLTGNGEITAPENADVNGDGAVDVFDLVSLRKMAVAQTNELTRIVSDPGPMIAVVQTDFAWGRANKVTVVDENGCVYYDSPSKRVDQSSESKLYNTLCGIMEKNQPENVRISDSLVAETRMLAKDITSHRNDKMGDVRGGFTDAPGVTYYIFGKKEDGSITSLSILTTTASVSWLECDEIQDYIGDMAMDGIILDDSEIYSLLMF